MYTSQSALVCTDLWPHPKRYKHSGRLHAYDWTHRVIGAGKKICLLGLDHLTGRAGTRFPTLIAERGINAGFQLKGGECRIEPFFLVCPVAARNYVRCSSSC